MGKWILQRDENILKQIYSDVAPFGKITKNQSCIPEMGEFYDMQNISQ